MATVVKTFTWDASTESFTMNPGTDSTIARDTTQGNPTVGSIKHVTSGRNKTSLAAPSSADLTGITWESLGVPAGATVTNVQVTDIRTRYGLTDSNTVDQYGPVDIWVYATGGTVSVTGSSLFTRAGSAAADGAWQTGSGTNQSVNASYQASNTGIEVHVELQSDNGNNASAASSVHADYVQLTITYNAAATTYNGSFTADAYIKRIFEQTFTADANIKKVDIAQSFTADAYILLTTGGTFTADAFIGLQTQGDFTADAYIQTTVAGNFSADAYVQTTAESTFTADGHISATITGTFTADAYIQGTAPTVPVWVSPADTSSVTATPVLVFTIPDGPAGNYHFNMEIDTAATFDTGNLRSLRTHVDQTGWEYDSTGAGGWTPVPSSGVPSTYAGNDARYTVQTPLASGIWYRRVRAGV